MAFNAHIYEEVTRPWEYAHVSAIFVSKDKYKIRRLW